MSQNRRSFLTNSVLSIGAITVGSKATSKDSPNAYRALDLLQPMTNDIIPISIEERKQRIAKAQQLMDDDTLRSIMYSTLDRIGIYESRKQLDAPIQAFNFCRSHIK